ncbi:MAG TPA: carboxypeptidase-like regulatory domain-containing protein, partial [Vicinamibacterales bacterium]|nr:carboxypeptidase-like regulatory domain-containing protein [Vicinamibacterales bacterium]
MSAEDGRQPIRRAMVSLAGPSQISQITDEDGRFVFESLAAGDYAITATRAGFLPAEYGARRPGRLAARLSVAAGATVNDVTLYMARGAVIEGVVRDVNGQPAANVSVIVSSPATVTQFVTGLSTPWMTDDRGVYRAYGLAPGSYVVLATPPVVRRGEIVQPSAAAMDAALRSLTDRSAAASTPVVLPPFATTV